jgi:tetratricopeptide (TPR) repeat protein
MDPADLEAAIRQRWDFGDPSASYDVMTAEAAASPPGSTDRLVWQTQAARALGLQGRYEEADRLVDQAAGAADRHPVTSATRHARARIAIERGRILNSSGDPASAWAWFEQAMTDAAAVGTVPGLEIDAMHMLAIAAESTEASLGWNRRALTLAEASTDREARHWRGALLNNLGWNHHDAGRFEAALSCFERAAVVCRESGDARAIEIADWTVARTLRSLGRLEEALAAQQVLAAGPEGSNDGYVHEEIGECLHALGRPADASVAFARAHALLRADPWLVENEHARLERIARLAGLA